MKKRFTRNYKSIIYTTLILIISAALTIVTVHFSAVISNTQPNPVQTAQPELIWHRVTVKKGDTLSKIFSRFEVSYQQLQILLKNPAAKRYLGKLYLGQTFYLHINHQKHLIMLKYPMNHIETLYLNSDGETTQSSIKKEAMTTSLIYKSGVIKHSLAAAAQAAGLTHHLTSQLSSIFSGTINMDALHTGDHFGVLYKEYYLHGKKDHPGNIVAASFTHNGKVHKALRFTYPHNNAGYYTPKGRGVEPLFLKKPLNYKRISGHFTFHRFDPVLHIVHPHLGIDYAAKYGTPIHSIGDGRIIFRGKKGGYGNAVVIRYSRKYRALYGHLSRIAPHLKYHTYVKKGQVIGYVGSSGWSTGPHLHFEMYVYGIPHDPLKMKFIGGKSIPKSYRAAFEQQSNVSLSELDSHQANDNK